MREKGFEGVLRLPGRELVFPRRPLLMGIVNVNGDSFSGDGSLDFEEMVAYAVEQAEAGADVLDVGAESARTNRPVIAEEEEVRRLRGFFEAWEGALEGARPRDAEQVWPPVLSVNTWRPGVVEKVLGWGVVELLNDMGGLPNARNAELCAGHGVVLLIMHTVGEPKVAEVGGRWGNVVGELERFFVEKINLAMEAGVPREAIVLDPGLGFAKNTEDDLAVMCGFVTLQALGCPLLLPISRKEFIGGVLGVDCPAERDAGTVACLAYGLERGAAVFRVHNVGATWQAAKVLWEVGAN